MGGGDYINYLFGKPLHSFLVSFCEWTSQGNLSYPACMFIH
uniref:Uncharacterized protein n=1 Tax=Anguilla anguilla TaxID=7936 RepID=A0A0E9UT36_ANGAN